MSGTLEVCVCNDVMAHDELKKANAVSRMIQRRATSPEKEKL